MILVTGGAGFIGSNFALDWLAQSNEAVVNLDNLTYAGNLQNLASLKGNPGHIFAHGDIGNCKLVAELLLKYKPRAVLNFAAESHVDRSIHGPEDFIQTNIMGTFRLLEEVRAYWNQLEGDDKSNFRFLHVSTDEDMAPWTKKNPLSPKPIGMNPIAPTQPARQPVTSWYALTTTPIACQF